MTLFGVTIVGFAAIYTLFNAIFLLIIMASKSFKVGDRVFFNGHYCDVLLITLYSLRVKSMVLISLLLN
jgi:small-conductance mechanosensitive channel